MEKKKGVYHKNCVSPLLSRFSIGPVSLIRWKQIGESIIIEIEAHKKDGFIISTCELYKETYIKSHPLFFLSFFLSPLLLI